MNHTHTFTHNSLRVTLSNLSLMFNLVRGASNILWDGLYNHTINLRALCRSLCLCFNVCVCSQSLSSLPHLSFFHVCLFPVLIGSVLLIAWLHTTSELHSPSHANETEIYSHFFCYCNRFCFSLCFYVCVYVCLCVYLCVCVFLFLCVFLCVCV